MTAKTDRLLRDLAQLFAKYSLSDWQPVLAELRQGADQSRTALAQSIEAHAALAAKSKRRVRSTKAARGKPPAKSVAHDDIFHPLQLSLSKREVLPTSQDLKAAALAIGVKAQLPSDRREASRILMDYLRGQSPEQLKRSLQLLSEQLHTSKPDLSAEFDRWVAVIMRPRENN